MSFSMAFESDAARVGLTGIWHFMVLEAEHVVKREGEQIDLPFASDRKYLPNRAQWEIPT
jgi:hypothetical protein